MGKSSAPAPTPAAAPQATVTALPETKDATQEPGARGAARRLEDLGQPSTANPISSEGAGTDPLGTRKTLTGGSATMMG